MIANRRSRLDPPSMGVDLCGRVHAITGIECYLPDTHYPRPHHSLTGESWHDGLCTHCAGAGTQAGAPLPPLQRHRLRTNKPPNPRHPPPQLTRPNPDPPPRLTTHQTKRPEAGGGGNGVGELRVLGVSELPVLEAEDQRVLGSLVEKQRRCRRRTR